MIQLLELKKKPIKYTLFYLLLVTLEKIENVKKITDSFNRNIEIFLWFT